MELSPHENSVSSETDHAHLIEVATGLAFAFPLVNFKNLEVGGLMSHKVLLLEPKALK